VTGGKLIGGKKIFTHFLATIPNLHLFPDGKVSEAKSQKNLIPRPL